MKQLLFLIMVMSTACSSGPKPVPDESKDKGDILDEPIDETEVSSKKKRKKNASLTEVMLVLPEVPEKMSKQIDGDLDDWKGVKFKKFTGKKYVEMGEEFWNGNKDTAMRVGIDSDGGWLYFGIEVKDDNIVDTPKGKEPVDSVVITLRDPGLDLLERSLPKGVGLEEYVDALTTIAIMTDGRVVADIEDIESHVEAATDEKKNGYVVEVAIKLEVFEEVTTLPLDHVAFRVDVYDGDEKDRPGMQTIFTSVPSEVGTEKRFALSTIEGLIPHAKIKGGPPRENAIGRWRFDVDHWSFVSFEVVPKLWVTLDDASAFERALLKDDVLGSVCNTARKDIELIEAYQSRGGNFRVGLVVCGQRAVKKRCSNKAKTRALFVKLEPDEDSWTVAESINVFEKPLQQCTNDPIKDKPYYTDFSLFPLDMMGSTFWMVGWTQGRTEKLYDMEKFGVTMLDTSADEPRVGTFVTDGMESDFEVRTYVRTNTYLTNVDEDKSVDVCQIERTEEQFCTGYKKGCKTHARGRGFQTHIFLWDKSEEKFEKYLLSKHKNCGTQFKFNETKAYLILQLNNRVGLLPSPTLNAEEEFDLF